MDFQEEDKISRKRKSEFGEVDVLHKKCRCGVIKKTEEVIWELFIQEPCIIHRPIFTWKPAHIQELTLTKQITDHYSLYRVMGQCKVFKKSYPDFFYFDDIWYQLFNENRIINLYARRRDFIQGNICHSAPYRNIIIRDILFGLKHLVLKKRHDGFSKKYVIQMLEL